MSPKPGKQKGRGQKKSADQDATRRANSKGQPNRFRGGVGQRVEHTCISPRDGKKKKGDSKVRGMNPKWTIPPCGWEEKKKTAPPGHRT